MAKQKVEVGQEVENKCPVCGARGVYFRYNYTLAQLRNGERLKCECQLCDTQFWLNPCISKITVKKVDKDHVV